VCLLVLLANVPGAHKAQTAKDEAPAAANTTLQTSKEVTNMAQQTGVFSGIKHA
jgi:hypothetical protein